MERVVECVPNFSEGRDRRKIGHIVEAIASASGTRILHIDSGHDANRTVVTFAGNPEAVTEAAFRGVKAAAEVIDMRRHSGKHPRSGATDVLPLVPVSGISLEECALLARALAKRIYEELGIPCYCYEAAAFRPDRRKLENCRKGEYESLPLKIADPDTRPDFGPSEFTETVARCGAINVGARNFLIAVNFNLDTESAELATEIAKDVRESGRTVRQADGSMARVAGTLKGCKAIGWYIKEYGFAQVSMNITDIDAAPLHVAFEEVSRAAALRGIRVTGTEIIGLVPRRCLIDAGRHFMAATTSDSDTKSAAAAPGNVCTRSKHISDEEAMDIAIKVMGLSSISPFCPEERTI